MKSYQDEGPKDGDLELLALPHRARHLLTLRRSDRLQDVGPGAELWRHSTNAGVVYCTSKTVSTAKYSVLFVYSYSSVVERGPKSEQQNLELLIVVTSSMLLWRKLRVEYSISPALICLVLCQSQPG